MNLKKIFFINLSLKVKYDIFITSLTRGRGAPFYVLHSITIIPDTVLELPASGRNWLLLSTITGNIASRENIYRTSFTEQIHQVDNEPLTLFFCTQECYITNFITFFLICPSTRYRKKPGTILCFSAI